MFYLGETDDHETDLEWQRFKYSAIAAHPEFTKEIMALGEGHLDEQDLAPALSDEEMESYQPVTMVEIGEVMDDLASFGLKMG